MVESTGAPIAEYFAALEDPRIDRTRRHQLLDIVTIAVCATICGADSWVDIELFGNCKEEWFKSFLELPNGIPSHDTFGDVFARLDPEQFQRCFIEWIQAVAQVTQGEVVAIDGKTVRRSHDRTLGKKAIHMVNVWASSNGLALGQTMVAEKSNEITAIPKLLQLLDLSGCIVTIDAMGCQKEIAREIIGAQADYLLAVKENQHQLYEDVRDLFEGAEEFDFESVPYDFARTVNKNHGRLETRQCWVITDPTCLDYIQNRQRWPKLDAVVKVTAHRETGAETSVQSRYYISSLAGRAKTLLEATRSHWSIENNLHWTLDVTFREDLSRVRKDHGPQNLAVLRQIALNLLKKETTLKRGIQGKRHKAGWVEDYLLRVLLG
ncbi:MAG: ISAs1 family transposase [Stenotrophomonas maltophilia]